jgi:hypothetical protein
VRTASAKRFSLCRAPGLDGELDLDTQQHHARGPRIGTAPFTLTIECYRCLADAFFGTVSSRDTATVPLPWAMMGQEEPIG